MSSAVFGFCWLSVQWRMAKVRGSTGDCPHLACSSRTRGSVASLERWIPVWLSVHQAFLKPTVVDVRWYHPCSSGLTSCCALFSQGSVMKVIFFPLASAHFSDLFCPVSPTWKTSSLRWSSFLSHSTPSVKCASVLSSPVLRFQKVYYDNIWP